MPNDQWQGHHHSWVEQKKNLFHAKLGNLLFARLPYPKLDLLVVLKADNGLAADGARVFKALKNARFKGKNSKDREQIYEIIT